MYRTGWMDVVCEMYVSISITAIDSSQQYIPSPWHEQCDSHIDRKRTIAIAASATTAQSYQRAAWSCKHN